MLDPFIVADTYHPVSDFNVKNGSINIGTFNPTINPGAGNPIKFFVKGLDPVNDKLDQIIN